MIYPTTFSPLPAADFLRLHSKEEHRLTEKTLSSAKIMRSAIGRTDYSRLIKTNYLMWSAVENSVFAPEEPKLGKYQPWARSLRKAAEKDLLNLEGILPGLGSPPVDASDLPQKIGVAYVLLGSGLGAGMMISRLRQCPEIQALNVFHFYDASAALTMEDWQSFRSVLNEVIRQEEDYLLALSAAVATFQAFRTTYQSFSDDNP